MPKQRVVVAMSGGVDSSVAAALLQRKGFEVVGVTLRLWGEENSCCAPEDVEDARRVTHLLGIPHYVLCFDKSFKQNVVDYFIAEYARGRTPNPCVVCNQKIRFGDLLHKARALGARYLATGHYAIILRDSKTGKHLLRRGKQRRKDQSYFLARLSQDSLAHTLFPLGHYSKEKVRELAKKFSLPVAPKRESQEVCFVPNGELFDFIKRQSTKRLDPGPILDGKGRVVGEHQGTIAYTIGQRKGLGITAGVPMYVTKIDVQSNTVFVGERNELYRRRFLACCSHWISMPSPREPIGVRVKIRHRQRPHLAMVLPMGNGRVEVRFRQPQRAITPGQLAVFYDGDVAAGSAWIEEVLS